MDYVVAARELEQQPIVSIRERRTRADVPGFIGRAFGELFGRLRLLQVPPAGPPFVVYHEFHPDDIDAEVCVPVAGKVSATGRVQARTLPSAVVARTLHVGPYEGLGAAYAALTAWVEGNGFVMAGPLRERYLTDPGDAVPPSAYRTEVEVPIEPATVAVPA